MADKSLRSRLQRLFSTNVIVRHIGGKTLKIADTNQIQTVSQKRLIDRYNRIYSGLSIMGGYGHAQAISFQAQRIGLFRDYEEMDNDAIISSALDIYADECLGEDTLIPLLDGRKMTIKELFNNNEENFWLYGLDDNGNFIPSRAEKVIYKGKANVYEIELEDGTVIKCTGNHRWVNTNQELVYTENLKVGDGIHALNIKLSGEKLDGYLMIKNNNKFDNFILSEIGYDTFTDFVNSSNHRILSIKKLDHKQDVYDIVNVGDNHIYALESNDGFKVYTHNSTMKSEYGKVLEIRSENENVHDILYNLFYDILNIEFNLWPWVRNMCKYGDFYLNLDIADKYGIVNVVPLSSYDVTRVEGEDPENPYYTKFIIESQDTRHSGSQTKKEFENFEIAHFRLLSDSNFLPYGKSMVEGGRKIWKQVSLMEDAMLIHRIMRAPEKRIFKIDIGNIPPAEVDSYMQKIINKMKKAPVLDERTGDYNLRYNIQNLTEDFFMPVRGGDSGTQVESLPGLTYEAVEDIEYLKNKLLAALKIPKAFLGYEEEVGSKATLAAEDVRFARTIERIQRIVVSELTKIGIVHLYAQGYTDADLVNFELNLKIPSTIYEEEKIELWNNKQNLATNLINDKIADSEWVYDNVFKFTEEEKKKVRLGLIKDQKRKFRWEQIEQEGNDPVQSNEAVGTQGAMAAQGQEGGGEQEGGSPFGRTGKELDIEMPDDGWPGSGRPIEGPKHGKDSSIRGRDPLGAHDKRKGGSGSPKYGLALAHYDALMKSLGKVGKEEKKIILESSDVEEEYKNEVSSSLSDDLND